jgi:hypothetical protein
MVIAEYKQGRKKNFFLRENEGMRLHIESRNRKRSRKVYQ